MRRKSVCDSGMIGPPQTPCMTRKSTRAPSEGANPHSAEQTPNPSMAATNSRTAPKRCASQPLSGTMMASATAYEVMTHVP